MKVDFDHEQYRRLEGIGFALTVKVKFTPGEKNYIRENEFLAHPIRYRDILGYSEPAGEFLKKAPVKLYLGTMGEVAYAKWRVQAELSKLFVRFKDRRPQRPRPTLPLA